MFSHLATASLQEELVVHFHVNGAEVRLPVRVSLKSFVTDGHLSHQLHPRRGDAAQCKEPEIIKGLARGRRGVLGAGVWQVRPSAPCVMILRPNFICNKFKINSETGVQLLWYPHK